MHLAGADEQVLLRAAASYLNLISEGKSEPGDISSDLDMVQTFAICAHAIMITKNGAAYGDTFESVLSSLVTLKASVEKFGQSASTSRRGLLTEIRKSAGALEATIATVFLRSQP